MAALQFTNEALRVANRGLSYLLEGVDPTGSLDCIYSDCCPTSTPIKENDKLLFKLVALLGFLMSEGELPNADYLCACGRTCDSFTEGLAPSGLYLSEVFEQFQSQQRLLVLEANFTEQFLLARAGVAANSVLVNTEAGTPLYVMQETGTTGQSKVGRTLGSGILTMVASAAIVAGVEVEGTASGRVRTLPVVAGTYQVVGRALTAAGAGGNTLLVASELPRTVVVP